jgi:hypothetical protein
MKNHRALLQELVQRQPVRPELDLQFAQKDGQVWCAVLKVRRGLKVRIFTGHGASKRAAHERAAELAHNFLSRETGARDEALARQAAGLLLGLLLRHEDVAVSGERQEQVVQALVHTGMLGEHLQDLQHALEMNAGCRLLIELAAVLRELG